MAFNGSKNFKKSELVDFLESIGTKFGPDLNAYTSFDETVYMLQVRTDSMALLDKGLLVLEDWAGALSFEDEEARDKFQSGEDRKISNISRFIEVKGRSNKGVEIELRGNAKDTAVKYKDRYYLYRLYKIDDGLYTLSILKNPIAAEEALEATVYVHIDRAKETETFEVSGGIVPAASAS